MRLLSSLSDPWALYQFLISIPIILLSLSIHEVSHGYVAYKLGDPTARNQGRLSLNPLAHIDPIGALCMLLFHFGWAKPVPVSTRYFKKPKRDMALTALAGPVSNILLAFVSLTVYCYIMRFADPEAVLTELLLLLFRMFYSLNISLAVFNFLPVPPLDGSRILYTFLPDRAYFGVMRYERYISIGIFALLYLGFLDYPLSWLVNQLTMLFFKIISFLPFL